MTIWWVFVSSCAWDAFAGKYVIHFSNSVTILVASSGVGTMSTRLPTSVQLALCTLNGASSLCTFALIVETILMAGARACTGGFSCMDDDHSPRVMSKTRWFFYCWYACDDFPARGGLCKGPFLGRVCCRRLFVRGWFIRGVLLLCSQFLEDYGYFT